MRGYEYLQFVGDSTAFFNAELRFPLIEAMLTPIGVLGGIRGVFFANMGGGHFDGQPAAPPRTSGGGFKWWSTGSELYTPIVGYRPTGPVQQEPIYGDPVPIDGFRLVDARASYGVGLETFALGFPIHFDWAWKTLFNKDWEDQLFRPFGGSDEFRKVKFSVWIGYDF
jgi:outer membrane protein assembly factor BamA